VAGATPRKAVENFVRPLQDALACVTNLRVDLQGRYELGETYALTVNRGELVQLTRVVQGHIGIGIRISQNYRIVEADGDRGPYKVRTTAYMYSVEDDNGHEVFGYHWHPESRIKYPHLHLEHGAHLGLADLHRAHFPTGRVSVEEFLRLVIEAFRVEPRREDWRAVIQRSQDIFRKWQTWT
jgi:hypothetical protein